MGYENRFEVSDYGNLRNVITGHNYKLTANKSTGYNCVCVSLGSRDNKKLLRIHRLVAEAFIPSIEGKDYVNHIDGVKTNNTVDNLEWVTPSENTQHAYNNDLINLSKGENHPLSKLTKEVVLEIRNRYTPYCNINGGSALGKEFGAAHPFQQEA